MIKLNIVCVGKIKEDYFDKACREYQKRLSRYCKLEITEIAPERLPENPSKEEINSALKKEAVQIIKKLPEQSFKISLCVEGKAKTSEGLAKLIGEKTDIGKNIVFIIGGSYGLCESIKEMSDLKLSLSEMTFPHRLFRVMLLEQIYRSFKINEGGNYHK